MSAVASKFAELFMQHALALYIKIKGPSQDGDIAYSGFTLQVGGRLLWVTAGHVVDQIQEYLADDRIVVTDMRWVDGYQGPGAETVPVTRTRMQYISAMQVGMDFGIVGIPLLDAANILQNPRVKPMTPRIWHNAASAQPDGYYLVGYPDEGHQRNTPIIEKDRAKTIHLMELVCLPVDRVTHDSLPGPVRDQWTEPSAFYGQRMSFADKEGGQPSNISGMSGGPILSIEVNPQGQMVYRLHAIQSSAFQERGLIRGQPIQDVARLFEEVIAEGPESEPVGSDN